jgi:hypothetical protein
MKSEQAFGKLFDTEHLFVIDCGRSEHVFEEGEAMSVALELEYEEFYPRLTVVPPLAERARPSRPVQRRRLVLGAVVLVLLVLLMLPIRALGGKTIAGSGAGAGPVAGQQYVVQSSDTLASIAARVDRNDVAGVEKKLVNETGSSVLVPGEHLLIP